jgi:F0F1-type ATP synthase alpha subunit
MEAPEYIYIKERDIFGKKHNAQIDALLYYYRSIVKVSSFVEIIDCNKLKILRKKHRIEQVLRQPKCKQFQFIYHLN